MHSGFGHMALRGLLAAAGAWAACAGHAQTPRWVIEGYVVYVGDGDTINILDKQRREHRVRLDGIDAPEKEQPFGAVARKHLYDLTYGLDVVATCHKVDQDRRDICQVAVGPSDVGLVQLQRGLAWVLVRYADELPEERRARYLAAEGQAKGARIGLWAAALTPVPPWEWRSPPRRSSGD